MIDGTELARTGCRYLGTPYKTMDCQKFFERCIADCGVPMDLGGSNSWYRHIMKNGWCGTPEECKSKFGSVPRAAVLFIWEPVSDKTPEQFKHDGIGDLTHMGIDTNMTGHEMCSIASQSGVSHAEDYNYGDGAIHSSASRGGVRTSKFAGKTISGGGWNRVGLWLQIDYGEKINAILRGESPSPDPDPDPKPEPEPMPDKAIVTADSGSTVKMRQMPSKGCRQYWDIPVGTEVDVLVLNCGSDGSWTKIGTWLINTYAQGYMKTEFLRFEGDPEPEPQPDPDPDPQPEPGDDWVMVRKDWLLSVYNQIGEYLAEG